MSIIDVGSTLTIQFAFEANNTLSDPDVLSGEVFLFDEITEEYPASPTSTFTPDQIGTGIYSYDWSPGAQGKYKVRLVGSFIAESIDVEHLKYFLIGDVAATNTLGSSSVITMLGELDPLYVDPEYVLNFYADADLIEVTEIIHRKSLELEYKVGQQNIANLTSLQHDFVFAATMCELSRVYGLTGGGLTGFTSASSFKLGDLEVDKGSGGGRIASGNYDDGNAGSWCELASVLKAQLSSCSDTMRPVVPGAIYASVVPSRKLDPWTN